MSIKYRLVTVENVDNRGIRVKIHLIQRQVINGNFMGVSWSAFSDNESDISFNYLMFTMLLKSGFTSAPFFTKN